jgi:hypothetical protein
VPASVEHPSWCDRTHCTATAKSGFHWSRLVVLDPDPRTDLGVTVQLGQGTPVPDWPESGIPLIDLTVRLPAFDASDEAEEYTLVLRGDRAVALGRMLVSAGREAGT